ncbi:zinc finger and BTB domain-containing protein 42 [Lynx rufus]|uniref:zinc finger and BTB domain-containing protein 42 n=1 Tax=Lynx rufus TaxID=61384 RepID=UPI001F125E28|nr:zinc finger and BTB domain-containing protein 42 [Lynx rufus]
MEFPEHGARLLGRLRQQREQGFLCDCTVLVGAARFPAHRAVLAACSVYFHLFYRDRPAGGRDAVRLNGDVVTAPAFGRLLDFMYGGRLDLRSLPVEDVLAAASYLHMYDVVKVCKGRLRDRGRALPRGPPAARAEPLGPPPPRTQPARAPEKTGPPRSGLRALPPRAPGPPPWQAPGDAERALDLSLKPGRRREPAHAPRVLHTAPRVQMQHGAQPPVRGSRDSPSERDGGAHGPPQPPCAPAAEPSAGGREPEPEPEPEPDAELGARGDELGPGARPCVCPLCGKPFPGAHVLQLHLSAHFRERDGGRARLSPDGTVPTCPLCAKTFSCTYTLKRHERTHSGEKPYTCAQCGKSFQYSHNLSRHAVVHTREKPHACRWCERRFTQSGDLYRHVRKFHCGLVKSLLV